MEDDKIIYSINIEDVQNVAQQEMGRILTSDELAIVEEKIGEHIDWFEAIASVISEYIGQQEKHEEL